MRLRASKDLTDLFRDFEEAMTKEGVASREIWIKTIRPTLEKNMVDHEFNFCPSFPIGGGSLV